MYTSTIYIFSGYISTGTTTLNIPSVYIYIHTQNEKEEEKIKFRLNPETLHYEPIEPRLGFCANCGGRLAVDGSCPRCDRLRREIEDITPPPIDWGEENDM